MRRPLAPVLAAALLALRAAPARGEPLDLDLARLGAPSASVWLAIAGRTAPPAALSPADAERLAADARARFAVLSSEAALALSSALLQPASTTGYAGFDVDVEAAYVAVHPGAAMGTATFPSPGDPSQTAFGPRSPWQTQSLVPHELFLPSFHVRKALPMSFELGGRVVYVSQSSWYAAQLEAKWALNEGFHVLPDVAIRAAHTEVFGVRYWNLGATELDLAVSRRWGVNGVTSVTPYLAARYTFVRASTDVMDFAPPPPGAALAPADAAATQASFPTLHGGFYRTTGGVRLTAYAVSLAAEATLFAGSTKDGGSYPRYRVPAGLGGAVRAGFEF
jgi:hypothetical protein